MSTRKTVLGLGRVVAYAPMICGVGLFGLAFSRSLAIAMVALAVVGLGTLLQISASNTVIQTLVDNDKRGRVMSLYTMAFFGMSPFGSLIAGALAGKIGVPDTLILSGIVCIVGSVVFARQLPRLRKQARPIYIREGIFPTIAPAVNAKMR